MATPNDSRPKRKLAATMVDSDPPEQSAGPSWDPPADTWGARPTTKQTQRRRRNTSDQMAPTPANAAPKTRSVGRWILAGALWGFLGALLVGPPLARLAHRSVEVGMIWMTPKAPGFLRPHLPQLVPPVAPPREHVKAAKAPEAYIKRELLPIQVLPPPVQSHKHGGRTHAPTVHTRQ